MADIMAALFFAEMRFDPKDPQNPDSDRFVLSKGHAAPILYAAWAEAGAFDRSELLKLRRIDSDLEGHPTPRLPFVDVATGSLGQGICAAIGIALNARRIKSAYRTYVLLGDGESAEGSVWEAANVGSADRTRQPVRHYRRQRTGPEPSHDVEPPHGAVRAPLVRLRLERHRHRWPRHECDSRRPGAGPKHHRASDDDPRAHDQGQRRVVRRREGGLAREGVQEGRGNGPGDRRARAAVRARAGQRSCRQPRRADSETGLRPSRRRHAETGRAARLQARRRGGHPRGLRRRDRQARRGRFARGGARRRRQELDVQRQVREGAARSLL